MIRLFPKQIRLLSYLTKTTINPVDFQLKFRAIHSKIIASFIDSDKSTSSHRGLNQIVPKQDLQLVVAGVDTVVPYSHRNGVSELWLDEPISIGDSALWKKKMILINHLEKVMA